MHVIGSESCDPDPFARSLVDDEAGSAGKNEEGAGREGRNNCNKVGGRGRARGRCERFLGHSHTHSPETTTTMTLSRNPGGNCPALPLHDHSYLLRWQM